MPKEWIADRKEMESLLQEALMGCLATVGPDGSPYITPLNFCYHQGKIYFHCAFEGRRMDNIRANPRVCFEAHELIKIVQSQRACDFGTRYRSVLVFGRARSLPDVDEKIAVLTALAEKYAGGQTVEPPTPKRAKGTEVIEITIEEMTGKRNVNYLPGEGTNT
jgi:nitroimidazol reductase NimA-like FMN-containing flavoprotein (pyridoxamine 5'-phosphate oxidase superfamily)